TPQCPEEPHRGADSVVVVRGREPAVVLDQVNGPTPPPIERAERVGWIVVQRGDVQLLASCPGSGRRGPTATSRPGPDLQPPGPGGNDSPRAPNGGPTSRRCDHGCWYRRGEVDLTRDGRQRSNARSRVVPYSRTPSWLRATSQRPRPRTKRPAASIATASHAD